MTTEIELLASIYRTAAPEQAAEAGRALMAAVAEAIKEAREDEAEKAREWYERNPA